MKSNATLSGSHLRTYTAIFRHPAAHNLAWHDVHALFRHLGRMDEEPNGNFTVTRNGQTLMLHPPRTKDVAETDEVLALRRFLERSESSVAAVPVTEPAGDLLLVINHHEARIFHLEPSRADPQRVMPHPPEDFFRHAPNSRNFSRGLEKPDPNSFFGPVAKALEGTGRILVFGGGTGTGSEMEQFVTWVKPHAPGVAGRIVGSLVIDEHHLTDAQILAKAREFFAPKQAV